MPEELTTPDTREKLASQIPAVELLMKLGFRYLPPTEALQARGGRKSEVLLTPILREQLTKLNRVRWRGREQAFSPDAIEGAIAALRDLPDEGLIQTSEKVYDLLSLGKSFPQTVEGDTRLETAGFNGYLAACIKAMLFHDGIVSVPELLKRALNPLPGDSRSIPLPAATDDPVCRWHSLATNPGKRYPPAS